MHEVNRREFLAMAAVAAPLMQTNRPAETNRIGTTSMFVSMHEASSARYDFKTAMEGYAKAGIRPSNPIWQGARIRDEGIPCRRAATARRSRPESRVVRATSWA